MLALSQDMQQNRPVEAREHIRRFHELFFTLSPDKSAIESNIQRALYLSDESAIGYYRNLQEKGYFNRMIAGNISQTLTVDSIQGNFNSYPYEMKTYSRQHIIRSSSVTERSLVTTCRLRNVTRSDNNPQGFLIESFTIIENRDIGQDESYQYKKGLPLVQNGERPTYSKTPQTVATAELPAAKDYHPLPARTLRRHRPCLHRGRFLRDRQISD